MKILAPQLLVDIVRGVRVPLKIDNKTISGDLGHYSGILIGVDLATELLETLMLEKTREKFLC